MSQMPVGGMQPTNTASSPGGKGAGQSAPGSKGAGQPQQAPGQKGAGQTPPAAPQGVGQSPYGQQFSQLQSMLQGLGQQPSNLMPQQSQQFAQSFAQGMPGSKGQPSGQPMPPIQGQPPIGQIPGGKGAGQPGQMQPLGAGQTMPGSKGAGQMDPQMMQALQSQAPRQFSGQGDDMARQQQPFHQAFNDQYNVQRDQRASVPYGPPGTNGSPQAYGQNTNVGGFGYGNGATQVPQIHNPMAGQPQQQMQTPMRGFPPMMPSQALNSPVNHQQTPQMPMTPQQLAAMR